MGSKADVVIREMGGRLRNRDAEERHRAEGYVKTSQRLER